MEVIPIVCLLTIFLNTAQGHFTQFDNTFKIFKQAASNIENYAYISGIEVNITTVDPLPMFENRNSPLKERNPEFWINKARDDVNSRAKRSPNLKMAKNVIMFLGDGMSLATITAARILKGQRQGKNGEEEELVFEKFPYSGLSKTYCADAQVADSACTSTAYICGVKTNMGTLGVSAKVKYNNCSASSDPANQLTSIVDWAQAAGMSTGFITTTTLTHASPSSSYAHVASRFWESDSDVRHYAPASTDFTNCMDMARQLVTQEPGRNFDLIMAGGMGKFIPKTMKDAHGNSGERSDNLNLLNVWQKIHPKGAIITNREELLKLDIQKTSHIMGVFASSTMDMHLLADAKTQPTLAEMVESGIELLSKNKNGYYLFVEGGLIDYANHLNMAALSLDETLEMEKAVDVAYKMTKAKDTLIVVTADHAHPLTISGYPERGNPILGINDHDVDDNGVKYATLNYATGPKQYIDENGRRAEPSHIGFQDSISPSYIQKFPGVHAGEDVTIYASGPHSHLFTGVMEQNSLPHLMAYAACIGDGPKFCKQRKDCQDL